MGLPNLAGKLGGALEKASLNARISKKDALLSDRVESEPEEDLSQVHQYVGPERIVADSTTGAEATMREHYVTTNIGTGYESLVQRDHKGHFALGFSSKTSTAPRERLNGAKARVMVIDIPDRGRIVQIYRPAIGKRHLPQDAGTVTYAEDTSGFYFATHLADGTTHQEVPIQWIDGTDEKEWILSRLRPEDMCLVTHHSEVYAHRGAINSPRTLFQGSPKSLDVLLRYQAQNAHQDYDSPPEHLGSSTLQVQRVFIPDENPQGLMHLDITNLGEGDYLGEPGDLGEMVIIRGDIVDDIHLQGNPYVISYDEPEGYVQGALAPTRSDYTEIGVTIMTTDGFEIKDAADSLAQILQRAPSEIVTTLGDHRMLKRLLGDSYDDGSLVAFIPISELPKGWNAEFPTPAATEKMIVAAPPEAILQFTQRAKELDAEAEEAAAALSEQIDQLHTQQAEATQEIERLRTLIHEQSGPPLSRATKISKKILRQHGSTLAKKDSPKDRATALRGTVAALSAELEIIRSLESSATELREKTQENQSVERQLRKARALQERLTAAQEKLSAQLSKEETRKQSRRLSFYSRVNRAAQEVRDIEQYETYLEIVLGGEDGAGTTAAGEVDFDFQTAQEIITVLNANDIIEVETSVIQALEPLAEQVKAVPEEKRPGLLQEMTDLIRQATKPTDPKAIHLLRTFLKDMPEDPIPESVEKYLADGEANLAEIKDLIENIGDI